MSTLLSMTGFGRGEQVTDASSWTVELRSVNHRFLDVTVKMPRAYAQFEERIKKQVATCHARGRVEVFVNLTGEAVETTQLQVNLKLARQYFDCFKMIQDELQLSSDPDLALLASNHDLFEVVKNEQSLGEIEEQWPNLSAAVDSALQECKAMRAAEGSSLQEDMISRLDGFGKKVEDIRAVIPELLTMRQTTLKGRLDKLLIEIELDPQRLAQEVAVMTDKVDVTEELVRLRSHIEQLQGFLKMDEPVGRRCDFLLQEFLREVNTIASKINNSSVAHLTVEMKNELEKIREQIQNLE